MTSLIGLLFFFSGAIGLGYEIVWIKILSLHFGNSAWSISAVVAAFMAGLGLGSWQAGRAARNVSRPLRAYAWLEFGIALFGLLSIPVFEHYDRFMAPLYVLLENHPVLFVLARLVLAFAVLIVPTFLMGASLPVLVQGLSAKGRFERVVSFLYGINTLGAAGGTLVTGFFLLPHAGIRFTLCLLAAGGFLIGALAWGVSRNAGVARPRGAKKPLRSALPFRLPWSVLVAAFVSGALGIFYEVGWARLLVPIIGSSTYAFSIILITFLIGIGLGSLVVGEIKSFSKAAEGFIGVSIALTALTAVAGLFVVDHLPYFFVNLVALAKQNMPLFFMAQCVLAGSLMFLPTFFLGVTLPLCMAYLSDPANGAVEGVGRVYAVNTIGSILGSLLAGFVFLPYVGVRLSVLIISGGGLIIGLVLFYRESRVPLRIRQAGTLLIAFAAVGLYALKPVFDVANLQRGYFRAVQAHPVIPSGALPDLLFIRDGVTSTVSVFRSPETTILVVNGKPDASTTGDLGAQYLIGHMPLAFNPSAKKACVIGYGSGATVNAVAGYPVEKIDVVELEPAVLEASPFFESVNDNVLADPRVHVHVEDGRTFLKYRKDIYDVIISEPSNPWIAGIGSLFTTEFYGDVKRRLSPDGVFCQWIQDYEVSDETRNAMLNTLADVFPSIHLFHQKGDLIVVASNGPVRVAPPELAKRHDLPGVKKTLGRLNIKTPFEFFIGYLASFPEDRPLYASPYRNTDDNLWLEFRAPLEMYRGASATLSPLPPALVFERFRALLFDGMPADGLALGLAEALYQLRPYAAYRIEAMRPFVSSPSIRRRLDQLVAAAGEKKKTIERTQDAVLKATGYLSDGKPQAALDVLNDLVHVDSRENTVYRLRGEAFFQLRKMDEAKASYRRAIELNPDDYVAHALLGIACLITRDEAAGEKSLQNAVQLNPGYLPARVNLGIRYVLTNRERELERLTADSRKFLSKEKYAEYVRLLQRKMS